MKRLNSILCVLMSVLLCLVSVSCGGNDKSKGNKGSSTEASSTVESTASAESTDSSKATSSGTYFSTDVWQKVPLVSKKILENGYSGGEGCQWTLFITYDQTNGKTAYLGTDVGGIHKSVDSGKSWDPCTMGIKAGGSSSICVDPKNVDHVILVGINSASTTYTGLYTSFDGAYSWDLTQQADIYSYRETRNQIIIDPTSYDKSLGYSKVAYWSREDNKDKMGDKNHPCIYKTSDGGKTWEIINDDATYGGCHIEIDADGVVYARKTSSKVVYRSTDGCKTFTKILDGANSIDVPVNMKGHIYAATADGFKTSTDKGATWSKVSNSGYDKASADLAVSSKDPNHMVVETSSKEFRYSVDGGKTWKSSTYDYSNSFMPVNMRTGAKSFNPSDANMVISLAGDAVIRSTDGGKKWVYSSEGYNVICTEMINFNVNNNNLVAVPSQDYNGGYSTDGGKTWTYVNWSGHGWGGFTYASYAADEKTVICGVADTWIGQGGKPVICVTHDGGKTVVNTGIKTSYPAAYGAVGNDNILFYGEYRSTDKGYTWAKMEGCTQVFAANVNTKRLYGTLQKHYVVWSDDNGESWNKCAVIGDNINSLSVTQTKDNDSTIIYASTDGSYVYTCQPNTDSTVARPLTVPAGSLRAVAVDPVDSNIVYVGAWTPTNFEIPAVLRSLDGGKTWTTISRLKGDGRTGTAGVRGVVRLLVNNKTRDVWAVGSCLGIWKMPAPPKK